LSIVYEKIINSSICKDYSLSEEVFEENTINYDRALNCVIEKNPIKKCLDFGAGWGTWATIAAKRGNDVYCYEISPIRKKHISNAGLKTITESELGKKCDFDIINCNQVLEHVPNPRETLKLMRESLSRNGGIWLTVPSCGKNYFEIMEQAIERGENSKGLNPWEHLNYFTPDSLLEMCKTEGLVPHKSFLNENGEIKTTECFFVKDTNFSIRKFLISKLKQPIASIKR
jgi:hypothetical protein